MVAMNTTFPPLFISHGSPMTALEPREAGAFMQRLGPALTTTFGTPRAVLAISAHSLTREPVLLAAAKHEAVYDFGGFPDELYQLRYDASGAPALAQEVHALLKTSGIASHVVAEGGMDHGIWTVLRYAFPQANIPVLPLAWVPHWSPEKLFEFGAALQSLSEQGVLIMGSGSITHNLRHVFGGGRPGDAAAPEIPESAAFRNWWLAQSQARHWNEMFAYRKNAPYAVDMHPTDEHLLPWFVAAGAGGRDDAPLRIHDSLTFGCLGMDAYAFGPQAQKLAIAMQ